MCLRRSGEQSSTGRRLLFIILSQCCTRLASNASVTRGSSGVLLLLPSQAVHQLRLQARIKGHDLQGLAIWREALADALASRCRTRSVRTATSFVERPASASVSRIASRCLIETFSRSKACKTRWISVTLKTVGTNSSTSPACCLRKRSGNFSVSAPSEQSGRFALQHIRGCVVRTVGKSTRVNRAACALSR